MTATRRILQVSKAHGALAMLLTAMVCLSATADRTSVVQASDLIEPIVGSWGLEVEDRGPSGPIVPLDIQPGTPSRLHIANAVRFQYAAGPPATADARVGARGLSLLVSEPREIFLNPRPLIPGQEAGRGDGPVRLPLTPLPATWRVVAAESSRLVLEVNWQESQPSGRPRPRKTTASFVRGSTRSGVAWPRLARAHEPGTLGRR